VKDAEVVQGPRLTSDGPTIEKSRATGVNIQLSAPKYSKKDEDKGVYVYPADAPKRRRFESEIAQHRIQIRSVLPKKLDEGGTIPGRETYVQFRGGMLTTNLIEEIVTIENCSDYGVKIWDVDALVQTVKKARINHALSVAEDDPEILEALKVKFNLKDFVDATEDEAEEQGQGPPESMQEPEEGYQGGAYVPTKGKKGGKGKK
jgi:hypothetical protein